MATQVNTNQIKDDAVTPAKLSFTSVQVLDWDPTYSKLIDNDNSETTIMSVSIPGGTLGSTGIITGKIGGHFVNNSGSSRTFTLRLKFGSTTLVTLSGISINNGTNTEDFTVKFRLAANGGPSAQLGSLNVPDRDGEDGASSIDSSGAQDLVVTMALGLADPDLEYHQHGYEVNFADPG